MKGLRRSSRGAYLPAPSTLRQQAQTPLNILAKGQWRVRNRREMKHLLFRFMSVSGLNGNDHPSQTTCSARAAPETPIASSLWLGFQKVMGLVVVETVCRLDKRI